MGYVILSLLVAVFLLCMRACLSACNANGRLSVPVLGTVSLTLSLCLNRPLTSACAWLRLVFELACWNIFAIRFAFSCELYAL